MDAHVIDLNGYLIDSIGLLRQILGERVMLSTSLAPDVGPIQLDLNQLQVALIGIATRARDTMPEGGRFVIETGNVLLNQHHFDIRQAENVQLSLTHSGAPTPPAELSTIYAFVIDSGGHCTAESDVERGTTVTFYFPARPR